MEPLTRKQADEAEILRRLIDEVLERSVNIYRQNTIQERAQLHQIEYQQEAQKFSVLGHIELFSDTVAGVASSIIRRGYRKRPSEALKLLESNNIFRLSEFNDWFFSPDKRYSGLCLYVELIDYLRRLCIDYLRCFNNI